MQSRVALLVATALGGVSAAKVDDPSLLQFGTNPIKKVVSLLTGMKAQVEKEAEEDAKAYEKYQCWCGSNKKIKDEAVEDAKAKIGSLEAFLEEAAGKVATLMTDISALEDAIAEDQSSMSKATDLRMEEAGEYTTASKDSKEAIGALREAFSVLSKVNLMQRRHGRNAASDAQVRPMLLQVRDLLESQAAPGAKFGAQFAGVMQQDLWSVMGALDSEMGAKGGLRGLSTLSVRQPLAGGAAAGAKSYNSASGEILGMISRMKDGFEQDLQEAMKSEHESLVAYQRLRSAKESEITAQLTQQEDKEKTLKDLEVKVAHSKEDLDVTKDALTADQRFLVELDKNCATSVDGYEDRSKVRADEIVAIGETIAILTTDDARDTFGKTVSFLQVSIKQHTPLLLQTREGRANEAVNTAMKRIMKVASKHHNLLLASLAVHMRLDKFEKVIEAIDKMSAELKAQQQSEVEKKDFCTSELDTTEDSIAAKKREQEDLEDTKLNQENDIQVLQTDIESINAEIADLEVSLKQAGSDRKAENGIFRQAVADQRATQNILKKALARLREFYAPSANGFVQQPGQAVAPPPSQAASGDYSKSGGAGGVLQMIAKVIADAGAEEAKLVAEEQNAQESYAELANDCTKSIEANKAAVSEKTRIEEQTAGAKSETDAALFATGEELSKLEETSKGMHMDCDWLLKFFDMRQKARQEEIDSIADAKAILKGADFGF